MVQLIVGLGNPGDQYANTRHNAGAWFLDELARQEDQTLQFENKFHGFVSRFTINSQQCWLLRPATYMNESGKSVAALAQFYKISPQSILVAHDELDFPAGIVRLKEGGGPGGHNGLRDIIQHLGSNDFARMRIGVGHPGQKDKVLPYVLGVPSKADRKLIDEAIAKALLVVPKLAQGELQKAIHQLHN